MPLHMTWTITGTVDDIYSPGAITAAAGDSLEQIADKEPVRQGHQRVGHPGRLSPGRDHH